MQSIENKIESKIKTGKGRGILFKHTSNTRNLAYKSELLMLIVLALREIGERKVTNEQLAILRTFIVQGRHFVK
jgi:hypothetical protein